MGISLLARRLSQGLAVIVLLVMGLARPLCAQPTSQALLGHLHVLAADSMEGRRTGTPGSARARAYLLETLQAIGVAAPAGGYTQRFDVVTEADTVEGVNVVGLIPGTRWPDRALVLTAHYDHLGVREGRVYNGADDNASGVAALLEIARSLQRQPLRHTAVIALLDAEEIGLQGAQALAAAPPEAVGEIVLNVNLDMVSRSERNELYAAGTAHEPVLRDLLEPVAARSPIALRFGHDTPGGGADWTHASDHAVFHRRGIPFVYFGVEDHPGYHQPSDDAEAITPGFYVHAVATMLDAVRVLDAGLPTTPKK